MRKQRLLCAAAIVLLSTFAAIAKDVTVNGVRYSLNSDGTATCKGPSGDISSIAASVEIAGKIEWGGKTYDVTKIADIAFENRDELSSVTIADGIKSIGRLAFSGCSSLMEIILPRSVEKIGYGAFKDCKRAVKAKLPNDIVVEYFQKGKRIYSPFAGCSKLEDITGTSSKYPYNILDNVLTADDKVPFYDRIPEIKPNSFSYYASVSAKNKLDNWMQKRAYESDFQWKERTSKENQQKKLEEITANMQNYFIAEKAPESLDLKMVSYDSDYGIFLINSGKFGSMYVKVPQSEANFVKEHWRNVTPNPKYGIVDDNLSLVACSFYLNGKSYGMVDPSTGETLLEPMLNAPADDAIAAQSLPRQEIDRQQPGDEDDLMQVLPRDNAIDREIPKTTEVNSNTFAVVIGNEDYMIADKVPFATNDAEVFAKYCNLTLGLPDKNIRTYPNATLATIRRAIRDIRSIVKAFHGKELNVIFYYSGHGIPDDKTFNAYLLPVDADGTSAEDCYSMARLYAELGELEANVYVFLDACFSGTVRGDGMIVAARGTAIKPKEAELQGNMVVFSAASGNETAFPYAEKGHGLFTYYLLSKIRESAGDVSLGELGEYITSRVYQESIVANRKSQTPTVNVSDRLSANWKELRLK